MKYELIIWKKYVPIRNLQTVDRKAVFLKNYGEVCIAQTPIIIWLEVFGVKTFLIFTKLLKVGTELQQVSSFAAETVILQT